jgi:hypothetical protein
MWVGTAALVCILGLMAKSCAMDAYDPQPRFIHPRGY